MDMTGSKSTHSEIARISGATSKLVISSWFAGLAWSFFLSKSAIGVVWWEWLVLVIGGMFGSSIVIGAGMVMVAALITKIVTGKSDGSTIAFDLNSWVSPILAFFATGPAIAYFS
jgi:hypothetical protein